MTRVLSMLYFRTLLTQTQPCHPLKIRRQNLGLRAYFIMQTKGSNRCVEEKIRRLAHDIYLHHKESGLSDDADTNWKVAECKFHNKLKYWWWSMQYFLRKYHSSIIAFIAILSLGANIIMMSQNDM